MGNYERYHFDNRDQEAGESINTYEANLRSLSDRCNFGALKDEMIRDNIVCGVRDSSLRKKLFQVPELTLQRCIDMCRSAEATSTQLKAMSVQNSHAHPPTEVNFVKKTSKGTDKSSFVKDCLFCSQTHEKERSKCPAFTKICSACQKENHFALKCAQKKKLNKTKRPRNREPPHKHSVNQFDFHDSGEEILSVSCYEEEINAIDNPSNKILATMKIGGKSMKMLIDSGGSCNVLPIKYLPKETVVEKSSHTLKMYSRSVMSAVAQAKIPLVNPKNRENYLIDFTNVDGNFAPLLGLETAQKMKILVVQTQNILSIGEDTLSCDAQKPTFTRDAVMSEHSDVLEKSLAGWKEKYTLKQPLMLLLQLCRLHVLEEIPVKALGESQSCEWRGSCSWGWQPRQYGAQCKVWGIHNLLLHCANDYSLCTYSGKTETKSFQVMTLSEALTSTKQTT